MENTHASPSHSSSAIQGIAFLVTFIGIAAFEYSGNSHYPRLHMAVMVIVCLLTAMLVIGTSSNKT